MSELEKKKKYITNNMGNINKNCKINIMRLIIDNGYKKELKEIGTGTLLNLDKLEEKIINSIYNIIQQELS